MHGTTVKIYSITLRLTKVWNKEMQLLLCCLM